MSIDKIKVSADGEIEFYIRGKEVNVLPSKESLVYVVMGHDWGVDGVFNLEEDAVNRVKGLKKEMPNDLFSYFIRRVQ